MPFTQQVELAVFSCADSCASQLCCPKIKSILYGFLGILSQAFCYSLDVMLVQFAAANVSPDHWSHALCTLAYVLAAF